MAGAFNCFYTQQHELALGGTGCQPDDYLLCHTYSPVLPPQQEGRQAQRRQPHKQRAQQPVQLALLALARRRFLAATGASGDVRRRGHHWRQLQRVAGSDEEPAKKEEHQIKLLRQRNTLPMQ